MTDDLTTETPEPNLSETSDQATQRQRECDEYQDLLLRKTAELDNYRKRTERERTALQQAAAADLLTEMLPLLDDLERALSVDEDESTLSAYRTGVELIHKQWLDLLEKRGVVPIKSIGTDFDPQFHQAVATISDDMYRDGEVVDEG